MPTPCRWRPCCRINEGRRLASEVAAPGKPTGSGLLPVIALVDPMCDPAVRGMYRAGLTGGYDLWGIWPSADMYRPGSLDRRPVPQSSHRPVSYQDFGRHEDPDLGTITPRGKGIRNKRNTAIRATGYSGGNMVHHGDETGRSQVFEVEMEFIAFIPGQSGRARFVTTLAEFRALMLECVKNYSIALNGAWQKALGFSATHQGHYEWP